MGINSNQSYSGLVHKYIGTAYDTVQKVADNLEMLGRINSGILAQTTVFLGVLEEAPSVRLDGTPLQLGDKYTNSLIRRAYIFNGSFWAIEGAVDKKAQAHKIILDNIVGLKINIPIPAELQFSIGEIVVMYDGRTLVSEEVSPDNADYRIDNGSVLIIFNSLLYPLGTEVIMASAVVVSTVSPNVFLQEEHYVSVGNGETEIPIPAGVQYIPGSSSLQVHRDGLKLRIGLDFTEISETHIELTSATQTAGEVFVFATATLTPTTRENGQMLGHWAGSVEGTTGNPNNIPPNWISARTGPGTYTIQHNMGIAKLIPQITPHYPGMQGYQFTAIIRIITTNSFDIQIARSGTPTDCDFFFTVSYTDNG